MSDYRRLTQTAFSYKIQSIETTVFGAIMEVLCGERKSATKELVLTTIKFFIQELKLTKSTYNLLVFFDRGMAKREDVRGSVSKIGPKGLCMILDPSLDFERLLITIAHEMVHVKQYARGQVQNSSRGKTRYWMGKTIRKGYYDQPWELEAFSKERVLANKVFRMLSKV